MIPKPMVTGNNLTATAQSELELFDLTYSDEAASNYILLLEVEPSNIRACWYHQSKNLVTGFASYSLKEKNLDSAIASLLQAHPFLASAFDQMIITVKTDNYMLAPADLNLANIEETYSVTNEFDAESQVLQSHRLIGMNANIHYACDAELIAAIERQFQHKTIVPHIAPMIEAELSRLKSSEIKTRAVLHIWDNTLDLRFYQDGELHLANSFFQTGSEDIAYYLLYCAEVSQLDTKTVRLSVSGNVKIGDETWNLVSSYWNKLDLIEGLSNIEISDKLEPREKGAYDYLTNSLLCAL
ncbi:MAG TPA: hypothetical protein DCX14_10820 [Flavobacteriales bacterium]|jgi:hypothetical protein|nr:DUF3822 family protein [Flavobacteriales bacterium]MDB9701518.1 DUF3822 family protein [Salibacteraceae bacterium]HAW20665.1 hypothetical protein [Flavobacteriales bacterium]